MIFGWRIEIMHHLKTSSLFAPLVVSKLAFMIKSTWKQKFSRTDKLFQSMNSAMRFPSGNKKANKWFLTFWKKDHSFWFSSFSQNKRSDQRAVTSLAVKPALNLMDTKANSQDKTLFQRQRNRCRPQFITKITLRNTYKNSRRENNSYRSSWPKQSIRQKMNMSTECCWKWAKWTKITDKRIQMKLIGPTSQQKESSGFECSSWTSLSEKSTWKILIGFTKALRKTPKKRKNGPYPMKPKRKKTKLFTV